MKYIKILFSVMVLFFVSCKQEKPKELSCTKFDAKCEMEKDYQLVQIIKTAPDYYDGYGHPLKEGDWYFHSSKANTFTPVVYSNAGTTFDWNSIHLADNPKSSSLLRNGGDVQSDTVEIEVVHSHSTGVHTDPVKMKILLFGSRYLQQDFDGVDINYSIHRSFIAKK